MLARHKSMTRISGSTTEHWRLIVDPACDGATNMAVDEAILESVGRGDSPPTLRLYRWEPACLSLGYAQLAADVDTARLMAKGWHIVRRMTGGRAILHTDELTYSVALPLDHPLVKGTIPESYRRISTALMAGLQAIGLEAYADKRIKTHAAAVGPVCFEVPSDYEITVLGKKLVGSAQVRKHNGALQHGSLPLVGDVSRICEVLVFEDDAARQIGRERVLERATTFTGALGHEVEWETAAEAVIKAFASTFSVKLDIDVLTITEHERARVLRQGQYAHETWTYKR